MMGLIESELENEITLKDRLEAVSGRKSGNIPSYSHFFGGFEETEMLTSLLGDINSKLLEGIDAMHGCQKTYEEKTENFSLDDTFIPRERMIKIIDGYFEFLGYEKRNHGDNSFKMGETEVFNYKRGNVKKNVTLTGNYDYMVTVLREENVLTTGYEELDSLLEGQSEDLMYICKEVYELGLSVRTHEQRDFFQQYFVQLNAMLIINTFSTGEIVEDPNIQVESDVPDHLKERLTQFGNEAARLINYGIVYSISQAEDSKNHAEMALDMIRPVEKIVSSYFLGTGNDPKEFEQMNDTSFMKLFAFRN